VVELDDDPNQLEEEEFDQFEKILRPEEEPKNDVFELGPLPCSVLKKEVKVFPVDWVAAISLLLISVL
jgi:hypothetical protein